MYVSKIFHILLLIMTLIVFVCPVKRFQMINNNDIITYSILCSLILLMYIDPLSTILLTIILIRLNTTAYNEDNVICSKETDEISSLSYIDAFEEDDSSKTKNVIDEEILDTKNTISKNNEKNDVVDSVDEHCVDSSLLITLEMLDSAQNNVFDEKNNKSYINLIGDPNANVQGVYETITGYNNLI